MSLEVTVYSSPQCVQCSATYRALDKQGIDYAVIDVTEDEKAYQHVVRLGFQQLPVVEAKRKKKDVEHWAGYRPDKIKGLKGDHK